MSGGISRPKCKSTTTTTTMKKKKNKKVIKNYIREIMFYEVWFNNSESISIMKISYTIKRDRRTHTMIIYHTHKHTQITLNLPNWKKRKLLLCFISIETKNMSKYISIHIYLSSQKRTICIIFMLSIYILIFSTATTYKKKRENSQN